MYPLPEALTEQTVDLTSRIPRHLRMAAEYIEKILEENGFEAFLVGGSVRDLLLGRKISDLDYTTNAVPEEIKKIFPKVIAVGEKFGTLIVLYKSIPIEITTYRKEGKYIDGRRPHSIEFGKSLDEDIHRRDFTINGLAYSVHNRLLIDHVGGINDLQKKLLRTIGNPEDRFREDGLRPIRGCRIMSNLNFKMDEKTALAMQQTLDVVSKIAPERFFDEWRKTLRLRNKDVYWRTLKQAGIFSLFFGDFKALNENDSNWEELLYAIQHSMPRVMGVYTAHFFYFELHESKKLNLPHDARSTKLIRKFFQDNRFPKSTERLCRELIFSPLLDVYQDSLSNGLNRTAIKKALSQIEKKNWFYHLRFCKEVIISKLRRDGQKDLYTPLAGKTIMYFRNFMRQKEPIYLADLAVTGDDLSLLGLRGKAVGEELRRLQNLVLEDPAQNQKETLLQFLKDQKSG